MLDLAIIIINYNSSNDIRALMTELSTSQLPEKTTITCVDNASSTEEKSKLGLADQTINLRIHYLDQNIGFGPACNLACKLTQAKQYLLLNPDISLQETTITNLIEGSKSSPNAGIWGGTTVDTNGNYDGASAWKEPSLLNTFGWAFGVRNFINRDYLWDNYRTLGPSNSLEVDAVSGCCLLINQDLWETLEGFDQQFFLYSEEIDLCLRARQLGFQPTLITNAKLRHAKGASMPSDRQLEFLFCGKFLYANKHFNALNRKIYKGLCFAGAFFRSIFLPHPKNIHWRSLSKKILSGTLRYD